MLTKMSENELRKPDISHIKVHKYGVDFIFSLRKQQNFASILAINGYGCKVSFVSPNLVENDIKKDHFLLSRDYFEGMMKEIIQRDFPGHVYEDKPLEKGFEKELLND